MRLMDDDLGTSATYTTLAWALPCCSVAAVRVGEWPTILKSRGQTARLPSATSAVFARSLAQHPMYRMYGSEGVASIYTDHGTYIQNSPPLLRHLLHSPATRVASETLENLRSAITRRRRRRG